MESEVERTLCSLLEEGQSFDYARVRELTAPPKLEIPKIPVPVVPDLAIYDQLLSGGVQ